MTTKDKTIFGAVVVVITLLIGWGVNNLHFGSQGMTFGSVGNLLAENYINYVRQNSGYNSQFPITTTGTITTTGVLTSGSQVSNAGTGTVTTQTVRQSLVAATTTPCAITNPLTATSTFSASLNVTTATSSLGNFVIATTTSSAFATTTGVVLTSTSIPSGTDGSLSYTGGTFGFVGPGGTVVFGLTTGSNGGSNNAYTYGGTCQATFTSIY